MTAQTSAGDLTRGSGALDSASNEGPQQRFVITEKTITRALTACQVDVKLGPICNYHKERAALRHYANQPRIDVYYLLWVNACLVLRLVWFSGCSGPVSVDWLVA